MKETTANFFHEWGHNPWIRPWQTFCSWLIPLQTNFIFTSAFIADIIFINKERQIFQFTNEITENFLFTNEVKDDFLFMKQGMTKFLVFWLFYSKSYLRSIPIENDGSLRRNPALVLNVFQNALSHIRWWASMGRSAAWTNWILCRCSDISRSSSCSRDSQTNLSLLKPAMAHTRCSGATSILLNNDKKGFW